MRGPRGVDRVEQRFDASTTAPWAVGVTVRRRGDRFVLTRRPDPRSFYFPVVRGRIVDGGNCVELRGTVRPALLSILYATFAFGGVLAAVIGAGGRLVGAGVGVVVLTVVVWSMSRRAPKRYRDASLEIEATLRQLCAGVNVATINKHRARSGPASSRRTRR